MTSIDIRLPGACPWCSSPGQSVSHGGMCPLVRNIEYHPWGGVKRVEFHQPASGIVWPSRIPSEQNLGGP
jgi:hypothetical protein